jgi:hypothetical protein
MKRKTTSERMERDDGWVSVKDHLPEQEWVLVYLESFKACIGMCLGKGNWVDSKIDQLYVTHWKYLPNPPATKLTK